MAGGSYTKKTLPQEPAQSSIPLRATRALQTEKNPDVQTAQLMPVAPSPKAVQTFIADPLKRHRNWMLPLSVSTVVVVVSALVIILAGTFQHNDPQVVSFSNAQVFPIQIGGSINAITTWQNSNGPLSPKTPIPTHTGPYSVLGDPSIDVKMIEKVLTYYNSPTAGKGQTLYDLGVKYGIDPVYALAFFMHESTLGTRGEATVTLSLGNIRCVPNHACRDGYSQYGSWEEGFEAWYKLIRNLYVAQLGLVTVDQIIPTYAPNADNNNEQGYIAALKHYVDTWHTGEVKV